MIKSFYYSFYYQFYKIFNPTRNGIVEWSSIFFISTLEGMNVLTYCYKNEVRINAIVIGAVLLIFNYFVFISKNRFLVIVAKYKNENRTKGIIKLMLVIIYIITTITLFFNTLDLW